MTGDKFNLRERTKAFALRIIRLYSALPKTTEAQVLGKSKHCEAAPQWERITKRLHGPSQPRTLSVRWKAAYRNWMKPITGLNFWGIVK